MTDILVLCRNRAAIQKDLDELFEYSRLFSMKFHICSTSENILECFVQNKPALFISCCCNENNVEKTDIIFLKKLSPITPIVVLGRNTDEAPAVDAYINGATGFLRLPCGSKEFYYYLHAILQLSNHYEEHSDNIIKVANLRISTKANQVLLNNEFIPLTNMEYRILLILAQSLNSIVSREQLYQILWNSSELAETSRAMSMHISKLRHKLGLNSFTALNIVTIHKKGYSLQLNDNSSANKNTPTNPEADYE